MKRKFTIKSSIPSRGKFGKLWQLLQQVVCGLCLILGGWLICTTITLFFAASSPVDAFFVLGGSIRREIYVAQQIRQYPQTPILISHGSPDPCLWLIFQREAVSLQKVWLEKCANSTFENFYYGIPILRRWKVHNIRLITSQTHLPRAKWMAQILLGAHGIWVDFDIVREQGIPGNREFWQKTVLDLTRSFFWVVFSQIIQPQCNAVTRLTQVDMSAWEHRGFKCERQGEVQR